MSDRFERCTLCGRLAPVLTDGVCSPRCAELAARGYTSPAVAPELAAPPRTTLDCRVLLEGEPPASLPAGCVRLGTLERAPRRRELLRLGADGWEELEELLSSLREAAGTARVSVLSMQQFVPGGLVASGAMSTSAVGGSG